MKNKKIKIRGKLKNNILRVKFVIDNPMLGEEEALRRNVEQDYITYIIIKVGTRILYEFKLAAHFMPNPLLKFKVKQKEIKSGDIMEIEWRTLLGETKYYSIEIQKSFNTLSKK